MNTFVRLYVHDVCVSICMHVCVEAAIALSDRRHFFHLYRMWNAPCEVFKGDEEIREKTMRSLVSKGESLHLGLTQCTET